jgi:redox-sensitive bicupin YhaK (pirin superfamily)
MRTDVTTVLDPEVKDLGGVQVRRLLPARPQQMVGPFIFFDHIGPASFPPGRGVDIRPHPHIGLATVTYLFEGRLIHRDSLGTVQSITPGDVNWMIAGRGIVHSERSAPEDRTTTHRIHGIQTWVALPKSHEQTEPRFGHYPVSTLPVITEPGVRLRLIAGSAYGVRSPIVTYSKMFYLAAEMRGGAECDLPPDVSERGVYVVDGEVNVGGQPVASHHLVLLTQGSTVTIRAASDARLMLIGGVKHDGDRLIWWNFVGSSRELIEAAKRRWREGGFPEVPGETEFIPLPER